MICTPFRCSTSKISKVARSIHRKCMREKVYALVLYLRLKRTSMKIIFSFRSALQKDLLDYGNRRTALEVQTDGLNIDEVKKKVQSVLGENFVVLTNKEQHKDLYRLLKFEKLFSFFSLSLLLLVGCINMFFSLMMLAIDKKKDISILAAIGAPSSFIKKYSWQRVRSYH